MKSYVLCFKVIILYFIFDKEYRLRLQFFAKKNFPGENVDNNQLIGSVKKSSIQMKWKKLC